eukprot:scaffold47360_cov46-Attheya_sp.AAC.3
MAKGQSSDNGRNGNDDSKTTTTTTGEVMPQQAEIRVVRNLALFRIIFFLIMAHEWAYSLPHYPLDTVMDVAQQASGRDRWFAYDQFEFLQDLLPKINDGPSSEVTCLMIRTIGVASALLAAYGGDFFVIAASTFTVLYGMRLFSM